MLKLQFISVNDLKYKNMYAKYITSQCSYDVLNIKKQFCIAFYTKENYVEIWKATDNSSNYWELPDNSIYQEYYDNEKDSIVILFNILLKYKEKFSLY